MLALTQGDPAGVGPELCLRAVARWTPEADHLPLLILERAAAEAVAPSLGDGPPRLRFLGPEDADDRAALSSKVSEVLEEGEAPVLDPVDGGSRKVVFGQPTRADAAGAVAAVDGAAVLALRGHVDAVVTAPLNKSVIARHLDPAFRGHTDALAALCGEVLERDLRYGRDYLMAFLADDLNVALLSTHVPLRRALDLVDERSVLEALRCMHRGLAGRARRIALAGLNPHAGEGGLLGTEDSEILAPAVERARSEGIEVSGPHSPDTVFLRARQGAFDWVLALYHDQGLVAVKTVAFGSAVNWTLGLPIVRTSVDHGTAYDLGGWGRADVGGLLAAVKAAARLVREAREDEPGEAP